LCQARLIIERGGVGNIEGVQLVNLIGVTGSRDADRVRIRRG
jgi:hypothetical protein